MTDNKLGHILKAAREHKNLSTRAVHVATGISNTAISRYEREGVDPSFLYMVLMCDLYDIDLNQLANTVRHASYHRDRHTRSKPNRKMEINGATLGKILTAGRLSKRLTVRAVEAITGISYVSISQSENNKTMPSFTRTVLMCDLYSIYLNDLARMMRTHIKK